MHKKFPFLFSILVLNIVLIMPIFNVIPSVNAIEGSAVATSTTYEAVSYGNSQKSFNASGRQWAFYSDGTNAYYESTTDPTTWSGSATSIGACSLGYHFSIWFDDTYVHYARYEASSYDLFYRRGAPESNGSITWSASEQTVYDGGVFTYYYYPMITVDSSGYAWIGCRQYNFYQYPSVFKNSENDGTWTTESGFPYKLSTTNAAWIVTVAPLTSQKIYVIYAITNLAPRGILYDSGWGSEETDITDYNLNIEYEYSAVAESDDIHFVYNRYSTYQIRYNKYIYGSGWEATDVLVQDSMSTSTSPALSLQTTFYDLYCFWMDLPTADHVFYKKCSSGTWDTNPTDWLDETTDDINYGYLLSCWSQDYDNKIGLLYMTKTASPYNVKIAYLDVSPTYGTIIITEPSLGCAGYNSPQAIYRGGWVNSTFFVYMHQSGSTTQFYARSYNHTTKTLTSEVYLGDAYIDSDSHFSPTIGYLWNGSLIIFYDSHSYDPGYIKYRCSQQAWSVDSWYNYSTYTLDATYPQILSWDDVAYLFVRDSVGTHDCRWYRYKFNSTGLWQDETLILNDSSVDVDEGTLYAQFWRENGTDIVLMAGAHHNYSDVGGYYGRFNLFFAISYDKGLTWETANGTSLSLPLGGNTYEAIKILDIPQRVDYAHAIIGADNKPRIMVTYDTYDTSPPYWMALKYFIWDGSTWNGGWVKDENSHIINMTGNYAYDSDIGIFRDTLTNRTSFWCWHDETGNVTRYTAYLDETTYTFLRTFTTTIACWHQRTMPIMNHAYPYEVYFTPWATTDASDCKWYMGLNYMLTYQQAIVDLSQTLSTTWNPLTQVTFNLFPSQAITSTWNVLGSLSLVVDLSQGLTTSWAVLSQRAFNVLSSLVLTTSWIIIVASTFAVGVSQSLSTTWTLTLQWNALSILSQSASTVWTALLQLTFNSSFPQSLTTTWAILTQWTANINPSQGITTTWTILTQSTFNIMNSLSTTFSWTVDVVLAHEAQHYIANLSQFLTTVWNILTQSTFNINPSQALSTTWNILIQWDTVAILSEAITSSWLTLASLNMFATLSQSLTTSWNALIQWNALATLSQSIASTWLIVTQWNALATLTQSATTAWNVLTQSTFSITDSLSTTFSWIVDVVLVHGAQHYIVNLSQSLSTAWNILIQSTFTVISTQSLSTTWAVLTESSFSITTSLSTTFTWVSDAVLTHISAYFADLSQSFITTWNILLQWNSVVIASQSITTTYTVLTQSAFNIIPTQSLTTTWQILTQSTFNITMTLSATTSWIANVAQGIAYYADLTLTITTSWIVNVVLTEVTIVTTTPIGLAVIALVIALIALGLKTKQTKKGKMK